MAAPAVAPSIQATVSTESLSSTKAKPSTSKSPKTTDATPVPASPKRPRVVEPSLSIDTLPLELRPLPSARELARVLCRIVDDEAYTEAQAKVALETMRHWASKQTVAFGNHFADVGGLQQVLFFVEDHMNDSESVIPALLLLETLCRSQGVEPKALSSTRTKIGKCIVEVSGVELMIKTFKHHSLPFTQISPELVPSASSSSSSSGLWSAIVGDRFPNCAMMICGEETETSAPGESEMLRSMETARRALEVLALLIPHAIGIDQKTPGTVLEGVCEALLDLLKNKPVRYISHTEALVTAMGNCLVAACTVAPNETWKKGAAKQVVTAVNLSMKVFPRHHRINRNGCLVLRKVCKHLPKNERKRLGVVAALGNILASDSMDDEIRDIADEILEEQFQ
mmetsp:Transcript_26598/g.73160  ORF Transcript_26598/g.73160 Transcript_26598/m.73160 type:complete len:397 (+) Transcript_26598:103-1293(+)